jgi:hypothetical protein
MIRRRTARAAKSKAHASMKQSLQRPQPAAAKKRARKAGLAKGSRK